MRLTIKNIAFITKHDVPFIRKIWRISRQTFIEMQMYFPNIQFKALSYIAFAHTWCTSELTNIEEIDFGFLSRMFYNHFDWKKLSPNLSPADIECKYLEMSFLTSRCRKIQKTALVNPYTYNN
jgi:hypothetical protein